MRCAREHRSFFSGTAERDLGRRFFSFPFVPRAGLGSRSRNLEISMAPYDIMIPTVNSTREGHPLGQRPGGSDRGGNLATGRRGSANE